MKKLAMLAAACAVAVPAFAQNVATVNGKNIPQKNVDQFVQMLVSQGATDSPALREQVKQELINREIFVQAAEKAGLGKQDNIKTEIEMARQGILVRALMTEHLQKNPVNDAAIQAEYDKVKATQGEEKEYQLRHILVEDEKTANDLIKQLGNKKTKFEDLAKKHSKDPGSAERGGELGWSPASTYVQPFAQAVTTLEKGKITTKPVQTQYGWHIIELQDSRVSPFPPLEQVRPQIEDMLRQQSLRQYQESLREKATIK